MKYFLSLIFSISVVLGLAQGPNTTSITVPVNGTGTNYNALQLLPNTYSTDPTTTRYPLLIFLHGQGEQGSSLSSIYTSSGAGGPAYFNAQGQWPTSFTNPVDGKVYKYIVISPQAPNGAVTPSTNAKQLEFILDYLIYTVGLRIDTSRMYLTGLSAGGEGTLDYPTSIFTDCSAQGYKHKFAAIVPMSADFNAGCMQRIGDTLAARHIGLWGFGDPNNDTHGANTSGVVFYANQWIAGSGRFTSYTGGHCCWNNFYIPTYKETFGGFTRSIYEWLPSYQITYPSTITPWSIGYGEYVNLLLNEKTHQAYDNTTGLPTLMTGPAMVVSVAGGPHHGGVIDSLDHSVWMKYNNISGALGDGTTTDRTSLTKILTDSLGNVFNNVKQVICAGTNFGQFWSSSALKYDGTVWVWGNTQGGNLGNGTFGCATSTRPVQIPIPGGRLVSKIQSGLNLVALCTDGTVWTWGGIGWVGSLYALGQGSSPVNGGMSPGQVTLPVGRTAVDIVGSGGWSYILLDNGHLLALGIYGDYLGIGNGPVQTTPQDVTTALNLPATIKKISVNNAGTYVILTDGSLYGWGSNAMGSIGNGIEPDYSIFGLPPLYGTDKHPYANDQGLHELMELHPVRILPAYSDFTDIYTNNALTWTVSVRRSDFTILSWGRNKTQIPNGVVGANPVNGGITSVYPNSWDIVWPTVTSPDSVTALIQSTSPYCALNPGGVPCNSFSNPNVAKPTLITGVNQNLSAGTNTTFLSGVYSATSPYKVIYHIWTQKSGPNTALIWLNSSAATTVSGLINGTYTFQFYVEDQNRRKDSATMTVTVGSPSNPPTVFAGNDQITTSSSINLSGTATGNNGASMTSTNWSQISGPNLSTIVSTGSLVTVVNGLIPGTYVFQLSGTDSNNQTSTDQIQVTVNSANPVFNGIQTLKGRIKRFIRF